MVSIKNIRLKILPLLLLIVITFSGCSVNTDSTEKLTCNTTTTTSQHENSENVSSIDILESIPNFADSPYIEVNNNIPYYTDEEKSCVSSFEEYSDLDSLGRCGVAYACVGQDIMPTEERGEIGMVKPTGWHTIKYDFVDGKYLYNRCHLLGYQLTGENANEKNLITGTRYLNVDGMLPFENEIANYVKETNNHVLYRVTPIFKDENLLASGVLMEAWSVEDNGEGVCFNVFCYNVQPGVVIDYVTGESSLDTTTNTTTSVVTNKSVDYILNTNTKKFHTINCSSVSDVKECNKEEFSGIRDELISEGYSPCGVCKP